jgi:hypothetical protein
MKKLIIIACYFGKLPNYLNLFMKSCEKNDSIDFLFVTDCESQIEKPLPENIHILSFTFFQITSLIKSTLGLNCICHKPYKLCDYRPAYGLIFSEYVKGYQYWGHCDIDLIFGNLKAFIDRPMIEGYNKIFSNGSLTLYRNTVINNNSFKLKFSGINYKHVFLHKYSFYFDESKGINLICKENNISYYKSASFEENYCLDVFPPSTTGSLKFSFAGILNHPQQFAIWDNGHVLLYHIENGELISKEYAYIHLQKRKFEDNNIKTEKYLILPTKFTDIDIADKLVFSKFNFNPSAKIKRKLHTLYKLHYLWYKLTAKWQNARNLG